MKIKKIQEVVYEYGQEEYIKYLIYRSKEPILIKIKNFTDKFSIDYFEDLLEGIITYDTYENNNWKSYDRGEYSTVMSHIKNNMPYRIFGQTFPQHSEAIERHVPLWQKIPFRPRYFNKNLKVLYFFGGRGAHTEIHFDREHCSNLHLCLSGKKEVLLFTQEQSKFIYKLPFIGDSLVEFGQPWDVLAKQFPRLKQAEGYHITLERGDMLFLPKNCWHYTTYIEASAAATYVFYPRKILQFYGYFTGYFFLGYKSPNGFKICDWPLFEKFSRNYALAEGKKRYLFKIIELICYIILLPTISILSIISFVLKPRRAF